MKYGLFIILLFLSFNGFGQEKGFADFIQNDDKIQWAAWYDQVLEITPAVKKFGIRQMFYWHMQNKKIDTYIPENNGNIIAQRYNKDQPPDSFATDSNPYKYTLRTTYLDNGDFINNEKNCSCIGGRADNKLDIYKIRQVLYYKNSNLYVKNILVTPLCLKNVINDDSNYVQQFVWEYGYSFCYNISADSLTLEQKKKCIDLGNSEELYNLRFSFQNLHEKVKPYTLRNPAFPSHLYEDILKNKVTVVDGQNEIIPNNKVLDYGIPTIELPLFDSAGYQTGVKKMRAEANIDSFYEYVINQHFYLDTATMILYSIVNHIELYRRIVTSAGIDLGKTALYRVYFIKPSLYKKAPGKKFLN